MLSRCPPRVLEIGRGLARHHHRRNGRARQRRRWRPGRPGYFREPSGLAVDGQGNLYVADAGDRRVRRIDRNGTISTYVGPGSPNGVGTTASAVVPTLVQPVALALDGAGNLVIADAGASQLFRVDTHGVMTVIAGQAGKADFPVMRVRQRQRC